LKYRDIWKSETIAAVDNVNLTGHFLIAMPAMADPYFAKSVAYVCEHNENGALGIVINRPIDMKLDDLFEQVSIKLKDRELAEAPVHFGGPVQVDRGFVLHQPVGHWQSTIAVSGETALTTSKDILEATARGEGPQKILVSLGYAGWSPGQLEQELSQNAWLTVPASEGIIFDLPAEEKLMAAMHLLGVDFASLSDEAGHA
jgi:putative transcriptional regulator